jgi:quercetin dioxygenase-like cupin family protein
MHSQFLQEDRVGRIGNRIHPGRYKVSSWKEIEPTNSIVYVEQRVMTTDRVSIVRCIYRAGSDFPDHFHPQEQVTIIEEGSLEFTIAGGTVAVGQGQMISIEPFVRHATKVADGYERVVALNLFLREPAVSSTGPTNGKGITTVLSPVH